MVGRAVVALVLALAMAGCTSGDDASSPTTSEPALATTTVLETVPTTLAPVTTAPAPAPTTAPEPDAIAGTMDQVQDLYSGVVVETSNGRAASDTILSLSPQAVACVDVAFRNNSGTALAINPFDFDMTTPSGRRVGSKPAFAVAGAQPLMGGTFENGGQGRGTLCADSGGESGTWRLTFRPLGAEVGSWEFPA